MEQNSYIKEKLAEDFWIAKLKDLDADAGEWRFDLHGAVNGFGETSVDIPGVIAERINRFFTGKNAATGKFVLYEAALKIICYRYFNQQEIVVAAPGITMEEADEKSSIIFLRSSLHEQMPVKELMMQEQKILVSAVKNQYYNYSRFIKKLELNKLGNEKNLLRIGLFYEGFTSYNSLLEKCSISLWVKKNGNDEETISFRYDKSLFNETVASFFLENYITALNCVVHRAGLSIGEVETLSANERELIDRYNQPQVIFDIKETVVDRFTEQVKQMPGKTAIVYENKSLTYQELDQLSDSVAIFLGTEYKIAPGDVIGMMMNPSEHLPVVTLGILKLGCAYVAIDHTYPPERKQYILKDSGCKLLLTENDFIETIKELWDGDIIARENIPANASSFVPGFKIDPGQAAFIIYTSGSTGQPKGMLQTHKCLYSVVMRQAEHGGFENELNVLQYSSVSFDVYIAHELFFALLSGGSLYIIPADLRKDLALLGEYIAERKIEWLLLPVSALNTIVEVSDHIWQKNIALKHLVSAGEQLNLSRKLIAFLQQNSHIRLHNFYGPSETHNAANYTTDAAKDLRVEQPIGRPSANTWLYILNESMQPVPVGVAGEVYIGGAGLAIGYINLDQLTEQRFIPNPFRNNERMYKTGDKALWLPGGDIRFLGRMDDQVKIRGFRVELGEIENTLLKHVAVKQCAVVARETVGVKELVAYVVADGNVIAQELRNYLLGKLPDYMVPGYFVSLSKLPLNTNGKVDKKNLPSPAGLSHLSGVEFIEPRNETEKKLLVLWQDVLKASHPISIKQSFFELGGHSLKVIRLAGLIHKTFGVKITVNTLFNHPTPEQQAQLIAAANKTAYNIITPIAGQEHYELSPSQQRLWLLNKMNVDSVSYCIYGTYEFEGMMDVSLLKRSIRKLVSRHEVLRTLFIEVDSMPKQKVLSMQELEIDAVLDEFSNTGSRQDVEELQQHIFNHRFELDQWPLFKLCFVNEENNCRLLFSMHHIISDGWSMDLFIRDISAIYKAEAGETAATLPDLEIQYKDYAHWQNSELTAGKLHEHEIYWTNKLQGVLPDLRLPYDRELLTERSAEAAHFDVLIDENLKNKIYSLALANKSTVFSVLIACFKIVLHRLTGETDLVLGTPVANRENEQVKDIIGFFLNTLMLRDKLTVESSFEEFMSGVNNTLLDGLEHQAYPFEKLLDKLNVKKDFNHFPISPVFLNMLNFDSTRTALLTDAVVGHSEEAGFAKFDLECSFREFINGIAIRCTYRSKLFNAQTIQYWMNEYISCIEQVVNEPNLAVRNIKIFSECPFDMQMPKPSNAFTAFEDVAVDQSIVSRFEQQVCLYPHNLAVKEAEQQLTYAELNALANGIASKIMKATECKGECIALLVEHGALAIAAMIGVLKSGNVYVPLDPGYPVERLRYMLHDANCDLLITTDATANLAASIANAEGELHIMNLSHGVQPDEKNPQVNIEPSNRAYILYTSGSTGQAKGVVQLHKNVLHFIRVYTNNLHIAVNDRLSLLPAYSFDSSVMDIYGALLNGAALYPYNVKEQGIQQLPAWLSANKITIFHTVPTIYRYFIATLEEQVFRHTRLIVLGGEAVYKTDFEKFRKHFSKGALFINGYGPTESTITLQKFLDHDSIVDTVNIPVGLPVKDTQVYLLNEQGETAGVYGFGEIVYRSEYLAAGYHNKKKQTLAAFTTDPVAGSGRVYRSGDLGRLLPTGEIEFVGRKDSQVKLNGQRIELAEIEQQLLTINGIREAVVVLKHIAGSDQLVAYLRADIPIDEQQIKHHLSLALPFYMVPAFYMFIKKFPLTPTGKISRLDLPAPPEKSVKTRTYVAPRTETEETIVQILQEVLGNNKIGVQDNYFELGGNSLTALRVLSRIRTAFSISFKMEEVFVNATIEDLAKEVDRKIWLTAGVHENSDEMITVAI